MVTRTAPQEGAFFCGNATRAAYFPTCSPVRTAAKSRPPLPSCPCCSPTATSAPRSTAGGSSSSRGTRRWSSRRASTCASTGTSGSSTTTSTRYIDPAEDQPDLTRLVEVDADERLRAASGRVRARVDARDGDAARRRRGPGRGQVELGRLGLLTHATAGFVDPGFSGHVTLELSQRRDPADHALARHEDRPALLLPAVQLAGREPLRLSGLRLALPGPARPDGEPVVQELPPLTGVSTTSVGQLDEVVPTSRGRVPFATLAWDAQPADAGAVVLVLHGGAVDGRAPNPRGRTTWRASCRSPGRCGRCRGRWPWPASVSATAAGTAPAASLVRRQRGPRPGVGGIPRSAGGRRRPLDGRKGRAAPRRRARRAARRGAGAVDRAGRHPSRAVVPHRRDPRRLRRHLRAVPVDGDSSSSCSRRGVTRRSSGSRAVTTPCCCASPALRRELVTGVTAATFADELGIGGDGPSPASGVVGAAIALAAHGGGSAIDL